MASGNEEPLRMYVAFHEAGHAVVAHALGRRFTGVSMIPDDESYGRIRFRLRKGFHPDVDSGWPTRKVVEEEAIISWAGMCAEAKCRRVPLDRTFVSDIDGIGLAGYVCGTAEEEEAYIEWLRIRAKNILDQPHYWAAVQMLAMKLLQFGKMTGKEAWALIEETKDAYWEKESRKQKNRRSE